jgi:hypothetical protein
MTSRSSTVSNDVLNKGDIRTCRESEERKKNIGGPFGGNIAISSIVATNNMIKKGGSTIHDRGRGRAVS